MAQALRFFVQYEAVLYFLLALAAIMFLYRFWMAWQETQSAIYGLEREASRGVLNQIALTLFLILVLALIVFSVVTFVVPTIPAQELLATPTLSLVILSEGNEATMTPPNSDEIEFMTATPLPTVSVNAASCVEDSINISEPQAGDTVRGFIEVLGTVDVPDFGFYKFEVARAEEELWLTIQAGRNVVRDGILVENWDTSRLPVGDYVLQIIVADAEGLSLAPCRIPVRIEMTEEEE
jgi:hypothetical protein